LIDRLQYYKYCIYSTPNVLASRPITHIQVVEHPLVLETLATEDVETGAEVREQRGKILSEDVSKLRVHRDVINTNVPGEQS
jgi:hypothetical protein